MEAIQELINTLQNPETGWLVKLTLIMGTARVLAKPISAWIQDLFTKGLAFVQGTPEKDDDAWVANILASKPYRVVAFLVDWAASVKLPNSETLKEVNE